MLLWASECVKTSKAQCVCSFNYCYYICHAAAKSLQSCPTLCNPIDGSPPGSPVPGILQARTLEWVAISSSNVWKWKVKVKSLSRVRPLACTAAYQAPLSMGFSRQNYWRALPSPPPGDLPDLGIKPASLMCPALADRFFTTSVAWEATPCIIMGPQNSCNGTVLILHFFFLWAQLATTGLALVSFFFPPHGEVSPHEHKGYTRELECSAFS